MKAQHHWQPITSLAASVFLAGGLVVGTALAAQAAPAMRPDILVATHYSQSLAGHVAEGNGFDSFNAVAASIVAPSEPAAVPSDSIAAGVVLGQNINGGHVDGAGLVWNDGSSSCLPGQWTVEYGSVNAGTTPEPVPTSDLSPALYFGSDICVNPGQSEYIQVYEVRGGHGVTDVLAGPSAGDLNVVAQMFGGLYYYHSAGEGVTTTSGADASQLQSGTLASFGQVRLTREVDNFRKPGQGVWLNDVNYGAFVGTVTGGAPSVANPVTLSPSSVGSDGRNIVSVP